MTFGKLKFRLIHNRLRRKAQRKPHFLPNQRDHCASGPVVYSLMADGALINRNLRPPRIVYLTPWWKSGTQKMRIVGFSISC